jgi:hypothetical protein
MAVSFIRLIQVLFNNNPSLVYLFPLLGRGLSYSLDSLRNATYYNHAFLMSAKRVVDISKYSA